MISEKDIIDSLAPIKRNKAIQNELNHVKNVFSLAYPNDKQVEVQYSKLIPSIWIVSRGKKSSKRLFTPARDFLFSKKQVRHLDIIDKIYSKLYKRIGSQYQQLIQFGLQKALDLKKGRQFTWSSVMNVKKAKKHLMFYCCYIFGQQQDIFGFTLFDRNLMVIEFDSTYVKRLKSYLREQYELYLEMIDHYYPVQDEAPPPQKMPEKPKDIPKSNFLQIQKTQQKQQKPKQTPLIKQQRNTSSNQPSLVQPNNSQNGIKQKLSSLLKKDLKKFEKQLMAIGEDRRQMQLKYNKGGYVQKYQLQNIKQEYIQLNEKIRYFKNTAREIQASISRNHRNFNSFYKRILMASKHLDSKLPIIAKKSQILQSLANFQLIILEAETGSGKSTQLPQILCEYFDLFNEEEPNNLPILITQPRRLAARALAQRVADELEEKVGEFVDYVDSDSRIESKRAKIVFKLDRIVLDQMIADPALSNYSCLVLDEAHERTINIDVIIGILHNLFKKARKSFKAIITSASMDIKLFQNYFKTHFSHIRLTSIKIPGRQYPVSLTYLNYNFLKSSTQQIQRAINDEILVDKDEMKRKLQGNVLAFCTSVEQIGYLVQKYTKKLNPKVFKVLALHGKLTTQEQNLVFSRTKQFKFIFCTRIAETAITIDGVSVVIDPGVDYQKIFDQKSKISSMKLKQISQSAAKQRAGRAGRTNQGFCFRLYSQSHLSKRPPNQIPQIQNESLQIVILRLKQLNVQNPVKFNYLSPPSIPALEASEQLLKMIGALDQKNRMNSIGRLLVKIPIQPFLSRAIAESLIYQSIIEQNDEVLNYFRTKEYNKVKEYPISKSVVEILCMVNADRLFHSAEDQHVGDQIKFQKFSDQKGDFFYLRNIFHKFMDLKKQYSYNEYILKQKLSEDLLNYKSLCEIANNQKQISMILKKQGKIKLNLISPSVKKACAKKIENSSSYQDLILSCLLSSFGTNLALYSQHPQFGYTLLKNKIPIKIYGTSTLSLQGIFPKWIIAYNLYQNQRGQIYCKVAHEVKQEYFEKEYLQRYLCDKLQVNKFIGGNPFFARKQYDTSTYIFNCVQQIYLRRLQFISYNWLSQNIELLFNDSNSQFSLFVCSQNDSIAQQLAHFDSFLEALNKNMQEVERFNYLGNRIILFDKQFEIFSIEFDIVEHIVQISQMTPVIFNLVLNHCYGFGKLEPIDYRTIRIYLDEPNYSNHVKNQLQNYRSYGSFHVKQLTVTRNYSEPNVEMIIYFFAGERSDNVTHNGVILTGYNTENVRDNLYYLREVINQEWRNKTQTSKHITSIISIEYSNIKIQTTLDEIQISNYINQLLNEGKFDPSFTPPYQFLRYRKPYIPQNTYSDEQWKQQIRNKLSRYADISNCIISISQFNEGQYGVHQRINICAIVTLQNSKVAEELSDRINNRDNIIGCDKIHTRLRYTMNVCTIPTVIYNYYQGDVEYIYMQQRKNGNIFDMHYHPSNTYKNQVYVEMLEIKISSSNKKMLFGPSKAIKRIFIPKIIKLTKIEAQGFNNRTDQILYEIRQKTKGQIIFQYKSKIIKIYCDQHQLKKIERQIKDILKTKEVKLSSVSYKGKNLNKVLEITKAFESKHRKTEFSYQINFRNKAIELSGNVQVIQECKYQINQINQKINPQCILCQNIIKTNFTLQNCRHSFCWECIANCCREEKRNEQDKQIQFKCPYQSNDKKCSADMCIQDIKILFSEEEFREICEAKIKNYVIKNNYKEYCMCSNCGQIFKENIGNRIADCSFCGSEIILHGEN